MEKSHNAETSLVARCPDGCNRIVFAVVEEERYLKDCVQDIGQMVIDGYRFESIPHEKVREEGFMCECVKP